MPEFKSNEILWCEFSFNSAVCVIFLNRAYTVGHHINHGATQTETVIIKLVLDSVAW